jgi:hypothetical protein
MHGGINGDEEEVAVANTRSRRLLDTYDLLSENTVEFLHRTAKDYVQNLVLAATTEAFNVHEALARSYLLQLKHCIVVKRAFDSSAQNWFDTVYESYYHLRCFELSANRALITITDTLSEVVKETWEDTKKGADLRLFAMEMEYYQGPSVAMATWMGLYHYVKAKVTTANYSQFDKGGWPLLYAAVSFRHSHSRGSTLDPRIIKHLLDCKADPNKVSPSIAGAARNFTAMPVPWARDAKLSPWLAFLINARRINDTGREESLEMPKILDVLEMFIRHSADLSKGFVIGRKSTRRWIDLWDILSETYEPFFPQRTQELKELMIKKGYRVPRLSDNSGLSLQQIGNKFVNLLHWLRQTAL